MFEIPSKYREMPDNEAISRIMEIKNKYGSKLIILGHHYQRHEIINFSDIIGDSFLLAKKSSESKAEFIVFCGVHFMAEAAKILGGDKKVFLPHLEAGCPMADMAEINDVVRTWEQITKNSSEKIIPITYMNSHASLKAFCGKNDGLVCTSSNAKDAFTWAKARGSKIFFFPDEHLGRNTASKLNILPDKVVLWEPDQENGGIDKNHLRDSEIILWKGHCHVHTLFTLEHVKKIRENYPNAKIIVHPECKKEIVDAVDFDGSTEFIVNFVKNADSGAEIAIGTEINLVGRLAKEFKDKKVFELSRSLCPNMYKINLQNLLFTLENLPDKNEINVDEDVSVQAKLALSRMLELKTKKD